MERHRPALLLVEDNRTLRGTLRRYLERRLSVELVEAASGTQAVGLARALEPDVILLDLSFPDRSATQLIGALRSSTRAARIVAMTGYDGRAFAEEALSLGAWACVSKEMLGSELEPTLRRALCAADLSARIGLDRTAAQHRLLGKVVEGLADAWTRVGEGLRWLDAHGPWPGRPRTRLLYLANVLELALLFIFRHQSFGF